MQEARDESPLGPGDEAEHAALIERQGAAKRDLDYRTRRNRINIVRRKRDIATLRLEGMWVVRGYNKAMADLGGGGEEGVVFMGYSEDICCGVTPK